MRYLRRRIRKHFGSLFIFAVGTGDSVAVLAQVLIPGRHHVQLHESVSYFAVPEQSPLGCAGAEPRLTDVNHSLKEGLLLVGSDRVRVLDYNWPAIELRVECQVRLGPVRARPAI